MGIRFNRPLEVTFVLSQMLPFAEALLAAVGAGGDEVGKERIAIVRTKDDRVPEFPLDTARVDMRFAHGKLRSGAAAGGCGDRPRKAQRKQGRDSEGQDEDDHIGSFVWIGTWETKDGPLLSTR
jgi:hypothetical protein